ncbi:MAG TPA: PilN domain-containing protein [Tepidisphaeraceae bacterium]|nr:PilN domain-containing protein [Tepidisphaeraceae bacterium]
MSTPNQLSFLPDDYLHRKAQRRSNVICAGLFIVVMTAIGTAFTYSEKSVKAVEQLHNAVEDEYADAARRIQQVQKMQEKQRQMAQKAELTASLLEKVPRTFILAELTNSLPAGVSLLDLAMEAKRAAVVVPAANTIYEKRKQEIDKEKAAAKAREAGLQPRVYDVTMKLTGIADTDVQVASYISKLNRSPLFKDVNLLISDQFKVDPKSDVSMRKFQIELTLMANADVSQLRAFTGTAAVELEGK